MCTPLNILKWRPCINTSYIKNLYVRILYYYNIIILFKFNCILYNFNINILGIFFMKCNFYVSLIIRYYVECRYKFMCNRYIIYDVIYKYSSSIYSNLFQFLQLFFLLIFCFCTRFFTTKFYNLKFWTIICQYDITIWTYTIYLIYLSII